MAKKSRRDALYFGVRLKAVLDSKGIKPADLANILNIDESQISRWIGGKVNPPDERKEFIADKLGVPLSALVPDPSPPPEPTGLGMRQLAGLDPANEAKLTEILERMKALEKPTPAGTGMRNLAGVRKKPIPDEFFELWPDLSSARQAICLYVLTRDRRFVAFLSDEILKLIERVLQSADRSASRPPRKS